MYSQDNAQQPLSDADPQPRSSFSFSYRPKGSAQIEAEGYSKEYARTSAGIMGPGYFDKGVWDEIITYINDTRDEGESKIPYSKDADVSPFKASEFNRISSLVDGPTVKAGDVIYGSLFFELEECAGRARSRSASSDENQS